MEGGKGEEINKRKQKKEQKIQAVINAVNWIGIYVIGCNPSHGLKEETIIILCGKGLGQRGGHHNVFT